MSTQSVSNIVATAAMLSAAATAAAQPAFTPIVINNEMEFAYAVYAADLDGDGDKDVIAAQWDTVVWYENDGTPFPTFTAHEIFFGGAWMIDVIAMDADGDGDLDVISARASDGLIQWHENDGASPPSFTDHLIFAGAVGSTALVVADVNGDGETDLISSSTNTGVQWYEREGTGGFTVHPISIAPDPAVSVFAADIDGDGDTDILSGSFTGGLRWYENDGTPLPSFTVRTVAATATATVSAADVDGDGDTDVLSAGGGSVHWHENDGALPPTFITHDLVPGVSNGRRIIGADLDNDGDTDLVASYSFSGQPEQIVWLENDGAESPSFTNHVIVNQQVLATPSIVAEDMDDDGDVDLLSASAEGSRKVSWYRSHLIPEGACCIPTGACLLGTEGACVASHGTYNGDGVVCDGISCPPAIEGDFDFDGDVDLIDFRRFQENFTGQP